MSTKDRRTRWSLVAGRILYLAAALSFIASLTVHDIFYAHGSRKPIPELGQTFPLHSRGSSFNSYITERQAEVMYYFLGISVLFVMIGFVLSNGGIGGDQSQSRPESEDGSD